MFIWSAKYRLGKINVSAIFWFVANSIKIECYHTSLYQSKAIVVITRRDLHTKISLGLGLCYILHRQASDNNSPVSHLDRDCSLKRDAWTLAHSLNFSTSPTYCTDRLQQHPLHHSLSSSSCTCARCVQCHKVNYLFDETRWFVAIGVDRRR